MMPHFSPASARLREFWRRNGLLLTILIILGVSAACSRAFLSASLISGDPSTENVRFAGETNLAEACSSDDTMFDASIDASMRDPDAVIARYRELASGAFRERENALRSPADWRCDADSFDSMAPAQTIIANIAAGLPAWNDRILFSSFSAVMLELQRVYECKLAELELDTVSIVYGELNTETLSHNSSSGKKEDSLFADPRREDIVRDLREEKNRSRIAMERALLAMRSFELAAPFTAEMHCLQRETVDVRLMMSLLSDTASCLPRAWDITTSLHDRAPPPE